jgi:tetratricopeptide (TPR) repeat protein
MLKQRQILKQQALREAEGYLELLHLSAPDLRPAANLRDVVAQRAIASLDRVGDFGAWEGHALFLRGQSYRMMERYTDAVIPLKKASELERENVSVWLSLGWCYKRSGRLDLAIEALEEALSVAPEHGILYYNLACYWSLAKNVQHAVSHLSRAFDLDPHYRDLVAQEADFDPIRNDPHFQAVNTVIV